MTQKYFQQVEPLVQSLIDKVGKKIVFAAGFGRPISVFNELYRRACTDPELDVTFISGLMLGRPKATSDLEARFLDPFVERVFDNLPELAFLPAYKRGTLPDNIKVIDIFFVAGAQMNNSYAQQHYVYSNFTYWFRDMINLGCNVFGHEIARQTVDGKEMLSLSGEGYTKTMMQRIAKLRQQGKNIALVGQINGQMPFMYNDAIVDAASYDLILDNADYDHTLLGSPSQKVDTTDYMIGLHASTLMPDDGTLQIGIGSLGDAITYGLIQRHKNNTEYLNILKKLGTLDSNAQLISEYGGLAPFKAGIYGSTEMFADGFRHLMDADILTREVYDDLHLQQLLNDGKITHQINSRSLEVLLQEGIIHHKLSQTNVSWLKKYGFFKPDIEWVDGALSCANGVEIPADFNDPFNQALIEEHCLGSQLAPGIVLHAGFFLGPQAMYQALRDMPEAQQKKISMTPISYVNQLYGCEDLARAQRKNARFMNTTIMATALGAACSDGLEDGRKVSGVGGQYNFVAMAHELEDGRSVLMCRSTRSKGDKVTSNVVWNYGHITIPAHLRDIVVTEYGIADLRSKQEKDVIAAMLNITDSRFQDELLDKAKKAGKIAANYEIPEQHRNNTPERLNQLAAELRLNGLLPPFPFGTDFTKVELVLAGALQRLKQKLSSKTEIFKMLAGAVEASFDDHSDQAMPYLKRMNLHAPSSLKEKAIQKMLIVELEEAGVIGDKK